MKKEHEIHGFINAEGTDIVQYVHSRHPVGECAWCDYRRSRDIAKEFIRRLDIAMPDCRNLNMWSLGSSLYDTPTNRKIILKHWARYRAILSKRGHRSIVFRVLESGRRGLLHIHYVDTGFLDHSVALAAWRRQTGEKSNVHVSGQKGAQDIGRLTSYLTKYLTKETTKYRWCGPLYGLSRDRGRRVRSSTKASENVRYGGITCYSHWTEQNINYNHDVEVQVPLPGGR